MQNKTRIFKAKAPITIIGVIIVGIICSAIYDAIVKPGFNIFSKFFFDLLTFGSQRAKDYTFSNAALDPSTLPSMSTMFLVVSVVFGALFFFNLQSTVKGRALIKEMLSSEVEIERKRKLIDRFKHDPEGASAEYEILKNEEHGNPSPLPEFSAKKTSRDLNIAMSFAWITSTIGVIALFILASITSQSVLIWRQFNANINIITPYVTQAEITKLRSSFSQVKTEDDYKIIQGKLVHIAEQYKLSLRDDYKET